MAKPAQHIQSVTGLGWEDSCGSKVSLGDPHVLETPAVPQGLKTRMQQRSPLNLLWSDL